MQELCRFLATKRARPWHPAPKDVFAAFRLTQFDAARVVIVGQDPYPDPTHAMGLAFSVRADVRPLPASLRNIMHALQSDYPSIPPAHSGDLTR